MVVQNTIILSVWVHIVINHLLKHYIVKRNFSLFIT